MMPVIEARPSGRYLSKAWNSATFVAGTNFDTLLSDEEYENNLHDHAVPSKSNQHRSSESVER